jgi:hypothetical protein
MSWPLERRHPSGTPALRMGAPTLGFLMPKQVSGLSAFKETYLIYSQFSGDAAHPTLTALARHWGPVDGKISYFVVEQNPRMMSLMRHYISLERELCE